MRHFPDVVEGVNHIIMAVPITDGETKRYVVRTINPSDISPTLFSGKIKGQEHFRDR